MGTRIFVDTTDLVGFEKVLSPQVTQAIRSSVRNSVKTVQNKWVFSNGYPRLDYKNVRYSSESNGFTYKAEIDGALPHTPAQLKFKLTNDDSVSKSEDGTWNIPATNGWGVPMNIERVNKRLQRPNKRVKKKASGLNAILQSNKKSKLAPQLPQTSDPLKWMNAVNDEIDKLTPFVETTFVDSVINRFNGVV